MYIAPIKLVFTLVFSGTREETDQTDDIADFWVVQLWGRDLLLMKEMRILLGTLCFTCVPFTRSTYLPFYYFLPYYVIFLCGYVLI
jgi:hypothetical protein